MKKLISASLLAAVVGSPAAFARISNTDDLSQVRAAQAQGEHLSVGQRTSLRSKAILYKTILHYAKRDQGIANLVGLGDHRGVVISAGLAGPAAEIYLAGLGAKKLSEARFGELDRKVSEQYALLRHEEGELAKLQKNVATIDGEAAKTELAASQLERTKVVETRIEEIRGTVARIEENTSIIERAGRPTRLALVSGLPLLAAVDGGLWFASNLYDIYAGPETISNLQNYVDEVDQTLDNEQ